MIVVIHCDKKSLSMAIKDNSHQTQHGNKRQGFLNRVSHRMYSCVLCLAIQQQPTQISNV